MVMKPLVVNRVERWCNDTSAKQRFEKNLFCNWFHFLSINQWWICVQELKQKTDALLHTVPKSKQGYICEILYYIYFKILKMTRKRSKMFRTRLRKWKKSWECDTKRNWMLQQRLLYITFFICCNVFPLRSLKKNSLISASLRPHRRQRRKHLLPSNPPEHKRRRLLVTFTELNYSNAYYVVHLIRLLKRRRNGNESSALKKKRQIQVRINTII